jgi:hypothetical protein
MSSGNSKVNNQWRAKHNIMGSERGNGDTALSSVGHPHGRM